MTPEGGAAARQRAEDVERRCRAAGHRPIEFFLARDLLAVLDENTRLRAALTELVDALESPAYIGGGRVTGRDRVADAWAAALVALGVSGE